MINPENKFFLIPSNNTVFFVANYSEPERLYKVLYLSSNPYSAWMSLTEIQKYTEVKVSNVRLEHTPANTMTISNLKVGDAFKHFVDGAIFIVISIHEELLTYMHITKKLDVVDEYAETSYTILQRSKNKVYKV